MESIFGEGTVFTTHSFCPNTLAMVGSTTEALPALGSCHGRRV
jgi:hypothetical protein